MEVTLPIKPECLGKANYFALRVRGDSMIGAGINEGDYVIVQQQETANHGDIVVAVLGDETTVKFLRISGKGLFLEAANPAYPPISLTGKGHEPNNESHEGISNTKMPVNRSMPRTSPLKY
ncbi:MAG: hypothetical protein HZA12_02745 [Nitrospirae bacterium]|nr:hypothetical protein [Nitrospirota bacterium]